MDDSGYRLPPLAAVRAFEAAARVGSFTRAGLELGMSQAAVSYQIKLLEERLGLPLFLRQSRQVVLTEAGRQLSAAVSSAFDTLRDAFAQVRAEAGGILTINALHAFASNWLAPRLGMFQLAHPEIAVRLSASNELIDFARDDVDVAIRSGLGPWPGLAMHRLFEVQFTPMCSPDLLARSSALRVPADLLSFPLLSPGDIWWQQWFASAGVVIGDLETRPAIRLDSQQIEGRATLAGQGVGMLSPALWADELRSGQLVQPFPLLGDQGHAYWLVYPESRRLVPKIRAWRDWLLGEVERSVPAPLRNGAPVRGSVS
jgi:LysR family transcriptional regulator, glycine cleavage system transcriptional activator